MKKAELIAKILGDMYRLNPGKEKEINKEYRGWLNRQSKDTLQGIYDNRFERR